MKYWQTAYQQKKCHNFRLLFIALFSIYFLFLPIRYPSSRLLWQCSPRLSAPTCRYSLPFHLYLCPSIFSILLLYPFLPLPFISFHSFPLLSLTFFLAFFLFTSSSSLIRRLLSFFLFTHSTSSLPLPLHPFLFIYSFSLIPLHLFLFTYSFSFIPLHLFLFTSSSSLIPLHLFLFTYSS